jgi:hypothetical protein
MAWPASCSSWGVSLTDTNPTQRTDEEEKTMETVILVIQILCVAGLACGTALSMFQLMQGGREMEAFGYGVSNDFETGFRRMVRARK